MALKKISFIFVISLTFGIATPNQVKDVPFDVNEVINRVSTHSPTPNPCPLIPELTGEFLIDTSSVYIPAQDEQEFPSISFDGTNYFLVWQDDYYDIWGARVNPDGVVLDPAGIQISTAPNWQYAPAVAFDGTNYLVVWQDVRGGEEWDIYGARVNQSGIVLDTNGIAISTAENSQVTPSIAFDGSNCLVVWQDYRNNTDTSDIYAARVNQMGVVMDTNGIAISTATDAQAGPSIAFNGTNYFVVWEDYRNGDVSDIYGARVTQTGVVLDSVGLAISTATGDQKALSVTFNGTNYLVVWHDFRNGFYSDIYGARINELGIVLDTNGIAISTAADDQYAPSVAFDGTNYLVAWGDYRSGLSDIYGTRVNQAGIVLDTNGFVISAVDRWQGLPAVAFDGTNYLVVWQDDRIGYGWNIYGARVNQSGIVLDTIGIVISTVANYQQSPSAVFDGTNYFVVWQDYRRDNYIPDIYGARVSQTGVVLDQTSIPISNTSDWQFSPSIAFDGTNYFVVWVDSRNDGCIYGAMVNQAGVVLDSNGIIITSIPDWQESPSVAFDGINFLVVCQNQQGAVQAPNIYGVRVNQAGVVLDSLGIAISTADRDQCRPSIAFDGTNYFVVWDDYRSGSTKDIYGARVNQDGVVLDPNGIAISTAADWQENPKVAFDGTNYLVVWSDKHLYYSDVSGARVSQDGTVLDPNGIAISPGTDWKDSPFVIFDGTNYIVVFENHIGLRYDASDLYGIRVNPSGAVIDSFPVSTQPRGQYTPTLAHGAGNQVLITYSGWTGKVQGRTYNAMRIWGKFYPFVPGIEEENSKVKMQSAKLLEVYPNPAKSHLAIRLPQTADRQTLKIFDVSGKLIEEIATIASQPRNDREIKVSLKGINPGIYFLRFGKEVKKFLVVK